MTNSTHLLINFVNEDRKTQSTATRGSEWARSIVRKFWNIMYPDITHRFERLLIMNLNVFFV